MFKLIKRAPTLPEPDPIPPLIQGYIDERATTHVSGWMRDLRDPAARLTYEVVLNLPEGGRIIARGLADRLDPVLLKLSVGDAKYGFHVTFANPLTPRERDHLIVRPIPSGEPLELAPQVQGYVDERSTEHVAGWLRNRSDTVERLHYEVILPGLDGERVLGRGVADTFNPVLEKLSVGDAHYGFRVLFPVSLRDDERDKIEVRPAGTRTPLELAPALRTVFEPISHVAMDIVNNCNLRCPFCVFDYAGTRTTRVMPEATFDAALRLIPYVSDGNFWLSCLHEATMHPALTRFIERVPRQWRHKIMFTTNLARPMPDAWFTMLADSGLHHINISLESLVPALYERMRKGARWRIFSANWDKLIAAFRAGSAPPRLRYNIMAYRSNLSEIPELVRTLRQERLASQVEIRHTFDVAHIPGEFRDNEFLDAGGWAWLSGQLSQYSRDDVLLIPPPVSHVNVTAAPDVSSAQETERVARKVPHPLNIRMEWDGKLIVYGEWTGPDGMPEHEQFVVTNIHHLRDLRQFLSSL
jgi:sulfatase maturation enzyme AslB (radical SAM superfamily)